MTSFYYNTIRYQQELKEQREVERAKMEAERSEKLAKESVLRDKLIKNVQHLEQRKMEVQRQLLLRTLSSSGGQSHLKSAVVIPKH